MTGSARVFVSYRRQDTRHVAGRLADRLVERFQVFMDMDTIEPGSDFADVIQRAVDDCDVFLPVIGPEWAGVDRTTGLRRLDDPTDWVGAETVAALQRGVPVIPVLVDGAQMPAPAELPESLAPLARRQAMSIRHESFSSDVNRLIEAIERRLGPTDPFAPRAPRRLAEARRNAQLSTWNAQADKAASEGRWADAVVQLENVRSLDPNYPDLNRRLQAATAQAALADRYAQARRRHETELQARGGEPGWAQSQPPPGFPLVGAPVPPPPPGQGPGRPAEGFPPPPAGRRRTGLIIAAALLLVVAVVAAGVLLLRSVFDGRQVAGPPAGPTSATLSPSVSESPTPSASLSPSASTAELRTHIPSTILTTCEDYSPPTGDALEAGLVAAVRCELTASGAPKTVWYFLYGDTATMNSAYDAYITGEFKTDDCLQAREKLDYSVEVDGKKDPAGVLHCYDSDGATYFAWTHDALRIVTFAEDKELSYAQMKKWWQGAGPLR